MSIDAVERDHTESDTQWTLVIDGGFVRGNRKSQCSSFEVLTGRLATRRRTLPETPNLAKASRSSTTALVSSLHMLNAAGDLRFPMAGTTVMEDQSQLRWQSRPLIRCEPSDVQTTKNALSPLGTHLLAQVRCAVINGDLPERLPLFKKRTNELPTEVAAFLSQLQRLEASLPQDF
jgi:hypothetical protein